MIAYASDEMRNFYEGCLSLPGFSAVVPRARTIRVEYLDELWLLRTIDAAGTRDHALAVACHAPALAAGRKLLASWTGVELPEAPPHVTLYVEVDPRGIGVADHATLRERRIAAGPWVLFGLPYVRNNAR